MNADQTAIIDNFRVSSRSDMLNTLFGFEVAMRLTACSERRKSLQKLLAMLWPEYLER